MECALLPTSLAIRSIVSAVSAAAVAVTLAALPAALAAADDNDTPALTPTHHALSAAE